jgi:hypothetical protein
MKNDGTPEMCDVPRLMDEWRNSGKMNYRPLLLTRVALTDAAGVLVDGALAESRGMTPAEQRTFDEYSDQLAAIKRDLDAHKAWRIAEHGADQVHLPW